MIVSVANGQTIQSIAKGHINIPGTIEPITAYVFPDDQLQHTLLSLSQLCRAKCTITLTDTEIKIIHNDTKETIFHGYKQHSDNLWMIDIDINAQYISTSNNTSTANLTISHENDAAFVKFQHAVFGSRPTSTFINACEKGWLQGIPRLTVKMIKDNLPNSMATAFGYLDQNRQGQQSTKQKQRKSIRIQKQTYTEEESEYDDLEDSNIIYVKIFNTSDITHADATGRFPIASKAGNQYILVFIYKNYTHLEPMAARSGTEYAKAFERAIEFSKQKGQDMLYIRMDNETSKVVTDMFKKNDITHQYVPAGSHRANRAEPAIRRTKNHIIATLTTTSQEFPLTLWDELLPQCEITINILTPWGPNPSISAYEGFHGSKYDHMAHPMGIAGTLVAIHNKPNQRGTWDPHAAKGFYLGPALKHYRCWKTYTTGTQDYRISDTLQWFPEPYMIPGSNAHETLEAQIKQLNTHQ